MPNPGSRGEKMLEEKEQYADEFPGEARENNFFFQKEQKSRVR